MLKFNEETQDKEDILILNLNTSHVKVQPFCPTEHLISFKI